MKKLIRFLFPKYKVVHCSFYMGTNGMAKHEQFLKEITEENVQIINSFITYHRNYSDSHKPQSINYVIRYKL